MTDLYRLADLNVQITVRGEYCKKLLAPYKADFSDEKNAKIDFSVIVTDEELAKAVADAPEFSAAYHESLCVLRQISSKLLTDYNGFLFHSSTVEYNGRAYSFTAKSGTGKSTHATLLKEMLGEKLSYVNDDKPFVRYFPNEGIFYAYGNPWNGKHGRGENVKVPLSGVCFLSRGEQNQIAEVQNPLGYLSFILNQVVYPENEKQADNLLSLLQIMFEKVKFYALKCNMEATAPYTSFNAMMKRDD